MGKITVDAATANALKAAEPGAELVGPDGQPVGGFIPPTALREVRHMLDRRRRAIEAAIAAVSIEELRAADAAGGGIPHEEVVARLGLR